MQPPTEQDLGTALTIRASLDLEPLNAVFRTTGQVHVADFLETGAARRLLQALTGEVPWQLAFNDGAATYDLHKAHLEALEDMRKRLLSDHIMTRAQYDFQYLYNNYPITDYCQKGLAPHLYINRVQAFVNSPEFLDTVRKITGFDDIAFADAQATLYRRGHFLTRHDDDVKGKNRRAAYVISMTPKWRVEWGGILQFVGDDGHVSGGVVPRFNALNIFRVPQHHLVSVVSPFADGGRYSITGWLRTG